MYPVYFPLQREIYSTEVCLQSVTVRRTSSDVDLLSVGSPTVPSTFSIYLLLQAPKTPMNPFCLFIYVIYPFIKFDTLPALALGSVQLDWSASRQTEAKISTAV